MITRYGPEFLIRRQKFLGKKEANDMPEAMVIAIGNLLRHKYPAIFIGEPMKIVLQRFLDIERRQRAKSKPRQSVRLETGRRKFAESQFHQASQRFEDIAYTNGQKGELDR